MCIYLYINLSTSLQNISSAQQIWDALHLPDCLTLPFDLPVRLIVAPSILSKMMAELTRKRPQDT